MHDRYVTVWPRESWVPATHRDTDGKWTDVTLKGFNAQTETLLAAFPNGDEEWVARSSCRR